MLLVALAGVLLLIGLAAAFVAATTAAHRRAQGAVDLAALAGATALARGEDACGASARIAEANGARLSACTVLDADVLVEARVVGPRYLGFGWTPTATARAGPGAGGTVTPRT
ncbi:flp pilus-assembly TadE/G-like family protein [Nocardioides sp. MJB4]|uniref:Flp pilus-assembly TadE/G-like family protein n=1 Tax=Nocardioides donggukensis TaxID=2774019 RepID=A0A927K641_9ACTN|nr:flp pilus-assembly TadE/G-like family protein [Nocardioides donggukensis]